MEAVVGSLVVLLLLWLGIALGCAFGAKSILLGKGRSGRAGFWLGFCLGLTGLLIAALLSSTPEHEARKMQLQMQMMGIAPPPPGAPYPAGAVAPLSSGAATVAKPPTDLPSVIIALVVSAVYALGWLALPNYSFNYAFGDSETLALLVFATGVALAIAALVKKTALLVGLASGVALGLCGLGLFSLGATVGDWDMGRKVLFVLPVDIAAFVGSILIVNRSVARPPVETWWKQAALALAGAGGLLTLAASQPYGIGGLLGNASVWGGFVVAGLCLLKGGRTPLALAIAWSATTIVYLVGTEFRGLSWDASTTLQGLVMLVAGAIAGAAIWAFQQTDSDVSVDVVITDARVNPSAFVAAPAPVPAPAPAAFAVAPSGFAPAPPPVAAPPAPPMPPQPMVAPPAVLMAPTPVAHIIGQPPEATMPRSRPAQVAPIRLLFATGEAVTLSGVLVLGRAPVAPDNVRTAQTFVVADSSFTISSTHCLLSLEDGGVWVEDLGSTNGTDVVSPLGTTELGPGQRVRLTPADRVQLGVNSCRIDS